MPNNDIVSDKLLKKVEKTADKSDDDEFLVVSYDLPSENMDWENMSNAVEKERKKELKKKRKQVYREFLKKGAQLSQSVYVVRSSRIPHLIDTIDDLYKEKSVRRHVKVHIVGSSAMFQSEVERIITEYLDENTSELKDELEIVEQEIKQLSDADDPESEAKSLKGKLYRTSNKMNVLNSRVSDLEHLNKGKSDTYRERVKKLRKYRRKLMNKRELERWT